MWAHDLEKRQHQYRRGEVARTRKYVSKTAALAAARDPTSDLPEDAVGAFPTHKGPVKIAPDGTEVGARVGVAGGGGGGDGGAVPPPLPARR
jgi:hypothetical protein